MEAQMLQQIFDLLYVCAHCFAAMMGFHAGSIR